jgi:hypothetical protein
MLLMALPWRTALTMLGSTRSKRPTIAYYFAGEIGKYVPGGFWPVVGRGELARSSGVPAATAYASVALSLGALYFAAMVSVLLLLPLWISGAAELSALWVLALVPLGFAMLHPRPLRWIIGIAERLMRRDLDVVVPPWTSSVRLVVRRVVCHERCGRGGGHGAACVARFGSGVGRKRGADGHAASGDVECRVGVDGDGRLGDVVRSGGHAARAGRAGSGLHGRERDGELRAGGDRGDGGGVGVGRHRS